MTGGSHPHFDQHVSPRFDLALVAVYLIGITLFGLRFRGNRGADGK